MALKPWYKLITPREDLRDGRPLDASEFAVHLDDVREGRAPKVYTDPRLFFERTYMTGSLRTLAAETLRRLSGNITETNAVFNLATQFGGGKTHALTLLYHLARGGHAAADWRGVPEIVTQAGVRSLPTAAVAVFVGEKFDSFTGRGGDGTPLRRTPWGEIAYQLGGAEGFALVADHDAQGIAPGGDVVRAILPADRPCLILMDELLNYISRNRHNGLGSQFYHFLQSLSEEARARTNVVLVAAIPRSELEMTAEDESDFERFKKLLDRVGKAITMSAENEASEIIRRRLFEWSGPSTDIRTVIGEYAGWIEDHHDSLPKWFPTENARAAFESTYPFHPTVISVFERKWRSVPRFQQTRGMLRLLALWVSRAYREGYEKTPGDLLLGLGSAPLDDPTFRTAVFEQLGEGRLEVAVTTDIAGKTDAHADRLDGAAIDSIRKARLHRKVATAIFFESNGGRMQGAATMPEIRLDIAEPGLDAMHLDTVIDGLTDACYYLRNEGSRFHFDMSPNLNKIYADRRATVTQAGIAEKLSDTVRRLFTSENALTITHFTTLADKVEDKDRLTLVVLDPEYPLADPQTLPLIERLTRENSNSARTYKNALLWVVADTAEPLREAARKALAWDAVATGVVNDPLLHQQADNSAKRAMKDLNERLQNAYHIVLALNKDNAIHQTDLGMIYLGNGDKMVARILNHLQQEDSVTLALSPSKLVQNWPPAFTEWSVANVRRAVYASPQFPRLLRPDILKETIARGVRESTLAYVSKAEDGTYSTFSYGVSFTADDVSLTDDVYIIKKADAEAYRKLAEVDDASPPSLQEDLTQEPKEEVIAQPTKRIAETNCEGYRPAPQSAPESTPVTLTWQGVVPPQKWTTFYTKVLSRFAGTAGLTLTVRVEVTPTTSIPRQKIGEMQIALRELGLPDDVETV